jgi:hypothetical protein
MIDTQLAAPKRRRYRATGLRLPSGILVRPEPKGKSVGYTATIGQNTVRGIGLREFWENVGKLFRNRAIWANRNKRPLALQSEYLLDAFEAEDYAMTFEKPKGSAGGAHASGKKD